MINLMMAWERPKHVVVANMLCE